MEQSRTSDKCTENETGTPRLTRDSSDRLHAEKNIFKSNKGRKIKTIQTTFRTRHRLSRYNTVWQPIPNIDDSVGKKITTMPNFFDTD
jgi:hypothetical protein